MALTIIRGSDDAPLEPLRDRRAAILGYGNQGRPHALNMRDSGLDVLVGCRPGGNADATARADGFTPRPLETAAAEADLLILSLPDEAMASIYASAIAPHVQPGKTLGFLHGFAVHYGLVDPPPGIGLVMVAPKGPGTTLRQRYEAGLGLPALMAVARDSARGDAEALALAWAGGIGSARAGIIRTTFADETETDLFGEQTVLCGGLLGLVQAAFETLVESGYEPALAYLECCHEVKQVADLVYDHGPAGMMKRISNTAEFGAYDAARRVVDDEVRARLRDILADVRSGAFARRMSEDHEAGGPWLEAQRRLVAAHAMESPGEAIRALMRPGSADDVEAPPS